MFETDAERQAITDLFRRFLDEVYHYHIGDAELVTPASLLAPLMSAVPYARMKRYVPEMNTNTSFTGVTPWLFMFYVPTVFDNPSKMLAVERMAVLINRQDDGTPHHADRFNAVWMPRTVRDFDFFSKQQLELEEVQKILLLDRDMLSLEQREVYDELKHARIA